MTRPRSYPVLGLVLEVGGWLLFTGGVLVAMAADSIVMALVAICGPWLIIRGRRLRTPTGVRLLEDDDRPLIVYLRSFEEEQREAGLGAYVRGSFGNNRVSDDIPAAGPVEQYHLAQFFSDIGQYVTIGRPGEPLPHAGASRLYVDETNWQRKVEELLRRATLIVVRFGSTPGLELEMRKLLALGVPGKILLILTGRKRAYHESKKAWADALLPHPLPEERPKGRLLMFDDDWKPNLLSRQPSLPETLRPYLERNGVAVPPWAPSFMPRLRQRR